VLCKVLIENMGMREGGAAIATTVTHGLNMIIGDAGVRWTSSKDFKDMIFMYDRTVFKDVGIYLKIGIPGMLMLCFEWWAFEVLAIFTGLLSVEELAAEVVIINLISVIFMLPLGISYSASALTGNYLGQGNVKLAKQYAVMTIVFNVFCTSIVVALIGIFKTQVSFIFTSEPMVVSQFQDATWVLLIYIWFDTIHGVQSGIIRGLGRQFYGSMYTLFCYYILGMPLALVLCFTAKMGIQGLWLGFSIACIVLDIGFAFIIIVPNWQEISDKARDDNMKRAEEQR